MSQLGLPMDGTWDSIVGVIAPWMPLGKYLSEKEATKKISEQRKLEEARSAADIKRQEIKRQEQLRQESSSLRSQIVARKNKITASATQATALLKQIESSFDDPALSDDTPLVAEAARGVENWKRQLGDVQAGVASIGVSGDDPGKLSSNLANVDEALGLIEGILAQIKGFHATVLQRKQDQSSLRALLAKHSALLQQESQLLRRITLENERLRAQSVGMETQIEAAKLAEARSRYAMIQRVYGSGA